MSDTSNPFCTSGSSPPCGGAVANKNRKLKSNTAKQKRAKKSNNNCRAVMSVLVLVREFFGGEIDLDSCSNKHCSERNTNLDYCIRHCIKREQQGEAAGAFERGFVSLRMIPPLKPPE